MPAVDPEAIISVEPRPDPIRMIGQPVAMRRLIAQGANGPSRQFPMAGRCGVAPNAGWPSERQWQLASEISLRIDQNRDRPVIGHFEVHVSAKPAGLHVASGRLAHSFHELLEENVRNFGGRCLGKTRSVAPSSISE